MRVFILSTAFSGMAQRVYTDLKSLHHTIEEHYDLDPEVLIEQVNTFQPDVIICPFLTQRIPDEVWENYICLIVHPGIEGDRGPSSLDWAITEAVDEWGVTLLQADAEYDAGDIWGTARFPMRSASKTSIYKREVTENTAKLIKNALLDIENGSFIPRHLDYNSANVEGRERPLMKQDDRIIDWSNTSTEEALCKLRAADSRPGVRGAIDGVEVSMYGATEEPVLRGTAGEILAIHKGAFCCATTDGAVWIKQLKCSELEDLAPLKLPASMVLDRILSQDQLELMEPIKGESVVDEITVERVEDTAYVHFNFYNGAMNTRQCIELKNTIISLKHSTVKMIVLMGGEDFFSNGIHLNCIEASEDPAQESWNNINAIDDLILELINTPNQITISALRNNAGAGGVILALACDEVIARKGVVLNPHYKSMGLYGSEYWTYLLPKRVGDDKAFELTEACLPVSAEEAVEIGMADLIFDELWNDFHAQLSQYCHQLSQVVEYEDYLNVKVEEQKKQGNKKPLSSFRNAELAIMKKIFFDPSSSYHERRREFVYKIKKSVNRESTVLVERKA